MVDAVNADKRRGVVAAGDAQSAEAGAEALRRGGNAIDAAVGAAFAAFVCELPLASPMGGGVLVALPPGQLPTALGFFARAPGLGAGRPARLDFEDVLVDFGAATQRFHVGRGSVAVPLVLPGLVRVHQRWGRLPLAAVAEPAVQLGRHGFTVSRPIAYVLDLLQPIIGRSAEVRAICDISGGSPVVGATLKNPDLARTLEAVARRPEHELRRLYQSLAREFGPQRGGLITPADVAELEPTERAPVAVTHGAFQLFTMPTPSSGGILVALGIRLLEGVAKYAFLSSEHVLALSRVMSLLARLRDTGFDERCRDPEFLRALLDEENLAKLRCEIAAASSSPDAALGSTTHISAVDAEGAVVALTLTNGEGSGHALAGTGIHVNNLLGEEDIHPRGFHVDPPGTPLVTMMAPTILRSASGETLALGSGGSNRLRNAILAVVSHLVEHRVGLCEAIEAPRLHVEASRSAEGTLERLAFESYGLSPAAKAALAQAFANACVEFETPNMYFGGVHAARMCADHFEGAGDARRGGSFVVVD